MNLATRITCLRILFIPVFFSLLLYSHNKGSLHFRYAALGLFLLLILGDLIDGFIARIRQEETELGSLLDPLADKVLLFTAFILLALMDELPVWVVIVVILRDFILVLGWMILYIFGKEGVAFIRPSALGKITTLLQMTTVLLFLLDSHHLYYAYLKYLLYTMVGVTIASCFSYLFKRSRLLFS